MCSITRGSDSPSRFSGRQQLGFIHRILIVQLKQLTNEFTDRFTLEALIITRSVYGPSINVTN